MPSALTRRYIRALEDVRRGDVAIVGGKNASLGEMIGTLSARGVRVPGGFATTVEAYREFMRADGLDELVRERIAELVRGERRLEDVGAELRRRIASAEMPAAMAAEIAGAYRELVARYGAEDVAVRSSATAEDLVDASFAGQQDTYLNVRGEHAVIDACRRCFASLFTDRAISYRTEKGFDHSEVALSVGVQMMVRSDRGCSGVMFTIDPETGFPGVVVINGSHGLGELLVQGAVDPDEFVVCKALLEKPGVVPIIGTRRGSKLARMIYSDAPGETVRTVETTAGERGTLVLSEQEVLELARWGCVIESHYGGPMDIEWAKDGLTGELFVVQARPETVQSQRDDSVLKHYELRGGGTRLLEGVAIGEAIASGEVCVIEHPSDRDRFVDGSILVTGMTDPDWVPIMKRARAIVTDRGGRTCHAAIISRELGIPAIVGTAVGTATLANGATVTVCCAEGERGAVYEGTIEYDEQVVSLEDVPPTRTQLMLNIASPAAAFRWWRLPARGIGLARMEFIINDVIRIHPMALVHFDRLADADARAEIEQLTAGYDDKSEYFVDHLAQGIARIAASRFPEPVIVRMSDFKTNEYADLIGGAEFEPIEANPMLGFRGASRYYSDRYRAGFALECAAVRRVRERMGLDNVVIMIPFCRTLTEADRVMAELAANGLRRGASGLQVYMMCEIPSNVLLADLFAERFDGFSIGSNDLTQLILGVDRDSGDLAAVFDERDIAVKRALQSLMDSARRTGTKVGICGQAPSDYPEFAAFLVEIGIDSISLNPDSLVQTQRTIAAAERAHAARSQREPMNVLDCPDGMVGVLFIDEMQPPNGRIAAGAPVTGAHAASKSHSIPSEHLKARRVRSAFERRGDAE